MCTLQDTKRLNRILHLKKGKSRNKQQPAENVLVHGSVKDLTSSQERKKKTAGEEKKSAVNVEVTE